MPENRLAICANSSKHANFQRFADNPGQSPSIHARRTSKSLAGLHWQRTAERIKFKLATLTYPVCTVQPPAICPLNCLVSRFRSLLLNCGTNFPVTSPLPFLWLRFVVSHFSGIHRISFRIPVYSHCVCVLSTCKNIFKFSNVIWNSIRFSYIYTKTV